MQHCHNGDYGVRVYYAIYYIYTALVFGQCMMALRAFDGFEVIDHGPGEPEMQQREEQ
jgi:hypothetical protein